MICKIADLGVSVPDIGNLPERCLPYKADVPVDITVENLRPDGWKTLSAEDNYYLDSGFKFYKQLIRFDGIMLHSSAVVVNGCAYLFSGPCGIGKSTHARLYQSAFADAVVINDDKPALRRINGVWYAYGTPWCGKDGINVNTCAPVAGICFLHRGDRLIKRLPVKEATARLLHQTVGLGNPVTASCLMPLVSLLVQEIGIFEFYNHAEPGDAEITFNAINGAFLGKESDSEAK